MADQKRVTFHYTEDANYRTIPVSGAWGGITPKGHIIVNFYYDRPESPKSTSHEVGAKGSLGEELDKSYVHGGQGHFERRFEVGVVMDDATASTLIQWLQTMTGQLQTIREETEERGEDTRE